MVQLCETAEEDVELPCLGEDKRKWRRKSLCLIFILTSELGLGLELNNQSAILTDVDSDYLQPG